MSTNDIDLDNEVTMAPLDFDDDALDDWIDGGGITKHIVVMHGKPHLAAEAESLEDDIRLATARNGEGNGEELAGGEVGKLRRRLQEVYDEWAASRTRWTVTAITDKVIDEATAATVEALGDEPVPPNEPAKGAPQSKHDDYKAKLDRYEKKHRVWQSHQNAELVRLVVEQIEFADGRRARIASADQVLRMKETFGPHQIVKIIEVARTSAVFSPELKAPFSPSTSPDDQT